MLLGEKGVRPRPRPWLCAPSGGATVDVPKLSSRSKGLAFDQSPTDSEFEKFAESHMAVMTCYTGDSYVNPDLTPLGSVSRGSLLRYIAPAGGNKQSPRVGSRFNASSSHLG